ncbi:hypothetical protein B0O80DRAFT_448126 [Mortierella sp. GBAus27b]|nr:hypothetical protein B0O80DRAFT_448126 [Mortierella sp. GBAus27b]
MNAEWSSTTLLADYNRSVQQELYISLSGIGPDGACSVVRFTALPLDQVLQAPNQTFKGIFDLYSLDGAQNGTVSLTISAAGPPAPNGQLFRGDRGLWSMWYCVLFWSCIVSKGIHIVRLWTRLQLTTITFVR